MDTLILENFRCFAGRHEIPIRPLTLLVGENSTGKTSFLAAVRAAYDRTVPDFNEPPFQLGSYNQIAHYGTEQAEGFTLGQQFVVHELPQGGPAIGDGDEPLAQMRGSETRVEIRFCSVEAQPTIADLFARSGQHKLEVTGLVGDGPEVRFSAGDQLLLKAGIPERVWPRDARSRASLWSAVSATIYLAMQGGYEQEIQEHRSALELLSFWGLAEVGPRPYALGPTRARPRRTYDPGAKPPDPEGGHIPMVLAVSSDALPDFRERLEEFGQASGLYSNVSVRKLGSDGSDPFQIIVELPAGGGVRNLIDVGYGVSQAIPIVVDCIEASPTSTLLIQQPEVHLHPRAQAAMGSFFSQLVATGRNDAIVETHSDYLVDRVRMDVRDEKIKGSDVIILYFEQAKGGVDIHPIEIDAAGNITGVPAGYRRFFLDEQRRFLGVD